MQQVVATVISKSEPINGLERPHGRDILFSQVIRLRCPEIAREARPGQFVMVDCGPDCVLPRPFSVHRVIDRQDLALYFAVLEDGKGTAWLSQREVGDSVKIFGPLGNGFTLPSTSHNILLVAGGMGLAPLRFLADEALKAGCPVTLLYGAVKKNPSINNLVPSGVKPVLATEDGSAGHHGLVTDLLPEYLDGAEHVFACGPLPMYRDMAAKYPRLKKKPVQISLEVVMGCGRGVCYGCTIRTERGLKRVCEDGPVFAFGDIIWAEFGQVK